MSKLSKAINSLLPSSRYFRSRLAAAFGQPARAADGLAIPPEHLIHLVTGRYDPAWFLDLGKLGAETLRDVLRNNGIEIAQLETILDFGCGSGRIFRHLPALTGAELFGCDYNREMIAWCRKNLPFGRFSVNQLLGKLEYEESSFDFVFALSIFTHLTETQQSFWMNELRRILRHGGYFFLTTHGRSYEQHIPDKLKERFRQNKLIVLNGQRAGENFCAAFHPETYVRQELARGWHIVDFVEQGAIVAFVEQGELRQDVYLLRKPLPA